MRPPQPAHRRRQCWHEFRPQTAANLLVYLLPGVRPSPWSLETSASPPLALRTLDSALFAQITPIGNQLLIVGTKRVVHLAQTAFRYYDLQVWFTYLRRPMITETPALTLDDVIKLALPLGTTIVAAGDAIMRPVRWFVGVRGDSPLPSLEGSEFVLFIPGKGDATSIIRACSEARVAAIATPTPLTPMAVANAEMAHLPVLLLAPGSRIREVARAVTGLLLDRHGNMERRSTQIYQQLVQLASENAGLEQIIHELARYIDKAVVVQDKRVRIQVSAVPARLAADWEDITDLLTERQSLPDSLQDRHKLPRHTSPSVREQIRDDGLTRLIAPVINREIGRGYLSFIGPADSFDDVDNLIIESSAVVCALEMARAKAISEIEKRLRGDFLDSLMIGTVGEAEALAEGDRFGHDMGLPHIALVATWYGE